jgi:hypothetical protein
MPVHSTPDPEETTALASRGEVEKPPKFFFGAQWRTLAPQHGRPNPLFYAPVLRLCAHVGDHDRKDGLLPVQLCRHSCKAPSVKRP